jgi:phosphomannomutase
MLITSISGIRGTIGGNARENLTPIDVASFVSAYGTWILQKTKDATIVIGRDSRQSGEMIMNIAVSTLQGLGINVVRLDLATTPTVEMEVIRRKADGGIIITASHNPKEYNGIKMLNSDGEFLSAQDGKEILDIAEKKDFHFASVEKLGEVEKSYNHTKNHIQDILDLDLVDAELVAKKKYKVVVDAINSVGGIAVPYLLEKMGVELVGLNINPNGEFAHKPEPLEENLGGIKSLVKQEKADLGIVVDPDVDRLVLVDEQGNMFGEEYTIVSIADYVLSEKGGNAVSNLSSSRALADVTKKYRGEYFASAVGEKNVVEKMKEVNATIGGEGSGGVIYPPLHYGRDALVGIALLLTYLAKRDISASQLRAEYPDYFMSKKKVVLDENIDVDAILEYFWKKYQASAVENSSEAISQIRLPEFISGSTTTQNTITLSRMTTKKPCYLFLFYDIIQIYY